MKTVPVAKTPNGIVRLTVCPSLAAVRQGALLQMPVAAGVGSGDERDELGSGAYRTTNWKAYNAAGAR